MDLVLIIFSLSLFVLAIEMVMRAFEDPLDDDPRDGFPTSFVAILLWTAMVAPLFVSYA